MGSLSCEYNLKKVTGIVLRVILCNWDTMSAFEFLNGLLYVQGKQPVVRISIMNYRFAQVQNSETFDISFISLGSVWHTGKATHDICSLISRITTPRPISQSWAAEHSRSRHFGCKLCPTLYQNSEGGKLNCNLLKEKMVDFVKSYIIWCPVI